MVNTQKIANELNSKLNAIATTLNLGHTFKLMAHLGKARQGNVIEGVLRVVNNNTRSKGGTSSGVVNNQVIYVAEFVFPSAMDNYYALKVEEAVNELVAQYHGYSFTIDTYNVIWELSLGTPKDYAVRGGVGSSLACAFTVTVSFSNNGVLNGIKNWTLDGVGIPYENEAVILDKDGVTLSVMEAKTQQTIPTSQRKQYKFTIPYDKNSTVCTTLQNDILNGDFRKTYALAYNDGVVTYSAKVSLYKTGDMGTQKTGDATMMSVSFVDAGNYMYYDAWGNQIQYQIGLINFPFDDQSENTFYFDSQAAQQAYMESKVFSESISYIDMTAPNLNTTMMTNVVYNAAQTTTSRVDASRLAQLNYAVILKTVYSQGSSRPTYSYYYYWVTQCTQGADGILLLDLKLDTIQTYMFDPNLAIPDCLIERAHLNRWIDNGDGTVSFDGTPTSKLFEDEGINGVAKIPVKREQIGIAYDNANSNVSKWLQEYVAGWMYAFLPNNAYDYISVDNEGHSSKFTNGFTSYPVDYEIYHTRTTDDRSQLTGVAGIVYCPIFKDPTAQIRLQAYGDNSKYMVFDQNALRDHFSATALSIVFSTVPPVVVEADSNWDDSSLFTISGNILTVKAGIPIFYGNKNMTGIGVPPIISNTDQPGVGVLYSPWQMIPPGQTDPSGEKTPNIKSNFSMNEYITTADYTFGKTTDIWRVSTARNIAIKGLSNTNYVFKEYRPSSNYSTLSLWLTNASGNTLSSVTFANTVGTTGENTYFSYTVHSTYIQITLKSANISSVATCYISKKKPHLVGASKNSLFNPKLLSTSFSSLKLTNDKGSSFEYDKQKLNKNNLTLEYTEALTPDLSRTYFRITNIDGVYNYLSSEALIGLFDSADMGLMVDSTKLADMLVQNKNFFAIREAQNSFDMESSKLSFGKNIFDFSLGQAGQKVDAGSFQQIGDIGFSAYQSGRQYAQNALMQGLTLDNIKSSPNIVKTTKGNAYFNIAYTPVGACVEEYDMLDKDKESVNNQMFIYGFASNFIDDVKDYLHTRKYFNYVKAQITDIQGVALSNEIRNDIKQHFARGIRFWNYTTFAANGVQYDLENYELWLETQNS